MAGEVLLAVIVDLRHSKSDPVKLETFHTPTQILKTILHVLLYLKSYAISHSEDPRKVSWSYSILSSNRPTSNYKYQRKVFVPPTGKSIEEFYGDMYLQYEKASNNLNSEDTWNVNKLVGLFMTEFSWDSVSLSTPKKKKAFNQMSLKNKRNTVVLPKNHAVFISWNDYCNDEILESQGSFIPNSVTLSKLREKNLYLSWFLLGFPSLKIFNTKINNFSKSNISLIPGFDRSSLISQEYPHGILSLCERWFGNSSCLESTTSTSIEKSEDAEIMKMYKIKYKEICFEGKTIILKSNQFAQYESICFVLCGRMDLKRSIQYLQPSTNLGFLSDDWSGPLFTNSALILRNELSGLHFYLQTFPSRKFCVGKISEDCLTDRTFTFNIESFKNQDHTGILYKLDDLLVPWIYWSGWYINISRSLLHQNFISEKEFRIDDIFKESKFFLPSISMKLTNSGDDEFLEIQSDSSISRTSEVIQNLDDFNIEEKHECISMETAKSSEPNDYTESDSMLKLIKNLSQEIKIFDSKVDKVEYFRKKYCFPVETVFNKFSTEQNEDETVEWIRMQIFYRIYLLHSCEVDSTVNEELIEESACFLQKYSLSKGPNVVNKFLIYSVLRSLGYTVTNILQQLYDCLMQPYPNELLTSKTSDSVNSPKPEKSPLIDKSLNISQKIEHESSETIICSSSSKLNDSSQPSQPKVLRLIQARTSLCASFDKTSSVKRSLFQYDSKNIADENNASFPSHHFKRHKSLSDVHFYSNNARSFDIQNPTRFYRSTKSFTSELDFSSVQSKLNSENSCSNHTFYDEVFSPLKPIIKEIAISPGEKDWVSQEDAENTSHSKSSNSDESLCHSSFTTPIRAQEQFSTPMKRQQSETIWQSSTPMKIYGFLSPYEKQNSSIFTFPVNSGLTPKQNFDSNASDDDIYISSPSLFK